MLVKWSKREPVIQMILGNQKVEALLTEWVWKSLNSCIQPWREDDPEEEEPPPFSIDEDEVVIADSQIHSFPFDSDLLTYRSKPKPPEQTISLAGTFTKFRTFSEEKETNQIKQSNHHPRSATLGLTNNRAAETQILYWDSSAALESKKKKCELFFQGK